MTTAFQINAGSQRHGLEFESTGGETVLVAELRARKDEMWSPVESLYLGKLN